MKKTMVVKQGKGIDEQGVAYNNYPECPDCKTRGRVGRNAISAPAKWQKDEWYCYECNATF